MRSRRFVPIAAAVLAAAVAACRSDDGASRATAPAAVETPAPAVEAPPPPAAASEQAPETAEAPKVRDLPVPPSPFGPGYDPTREPPKDPEPAGPGFESAKILAFGSADVEELRDMSDSRRPPVPSLVGAVLEVEVSAGTVTPPLNVETVSLRTKSGAAGVLFADCVPNAPQPQWVARAQGTIIGHWHVAIAGRTWFCGGGTAKLAARAGGRGTWIKADRPWKGEVVLLFARPAGEPDAVTIPGHTIPVPAACGSGAPAACEIPAAPKN